jgi:hypothetical protein
MVSREVLLLQVKRAKRLKEMEVAEKVKLITASNATICQRAATFSKDMLLLREDLKAGRAHVVHSLDDL